MKRSIILLAALLAASSLMTLSLQSALAQITTTQTQAYPVAGAIPIADSTGSDFLCPTCSSLGAPKAEQPKARHRHPS